MEWFSSMSKYEFMTIILSFVVFIKPLAILVYKKINTRLKYYYSDEMRLYFNSSGSFICVYGACKAQNANIVINKVEATIKRKQDNKEHNLFWYSFISPITQSIGGNYAQTNEKIHPFQINENVLLPLIIEFEVKNRLASKNITYGMAELLEFAHNIQVFETSYDEQLVDRYKNLSTYMDAKNCVDREFIWKAGSYSLDMRITYDDDKIELFTTEFRLSVEDSCKLKNNINEVLLYPLKNKFGIPFNFYVHDVFK